MVSRTDVTDARPTTIYAAERDFKFPNQKSRLFGGRTVRVPTPQYLSAPKFYSVLQKVGTEPLQDAMSLRKIGSDTLTVFSA